LNNLDENSNHKKEIISKYNSSSPFYDNRYRKIQERKYQIIQDKYDINGKYVLDLGCGTGLLIEYLINVKKLNKDNLDFYVGVDISWNMLLEFKSKLDKLNSLRGLSLILSDIENLPFREDKFSSIFSITAFQNLPNINEAIREALRVSKDRAEFKISILKKKLNLEMFLDYLKPFTKVEQIEIRNDLEDAIIKGRFLKQ
jgi:ubiquinone/menaquinone biosynthesis C-methylase UbiE